MENDFLNNVWPEWKIVKLIGRGSFGVVYEAVRTDHSVESYAAIKVISIPQNESEVVSLRSEGLSNDAARTYLQGVVNDFINEIQLMESFKGVQNIVSVEDYKVVEKTVEMGWDIYIRMELLTPFPTYCSDKILSEKEVIKLGVDICTALELCSKRNVIHRDIKPQNIFINQFDDFKLGDFGIARKLENFTGGLSQKGSPNYMAPEVARSTKYDATVDLYSLGIVLYQLMNKNRLPFLETEFQQLNPEQRTEALKRRINGELLPPPCDASLGMTQVILRACSPNPTNRFSSASEMKKALIRLTKDESSERDNVLNNTSVFYETTYMQEAAEKKVGAFGKEKKSKAPIFIAVIFAIVFIAGGSAFAIPKFIKKNINAETEIVEEETNTETVPAEQENNTETEIVEQESSTETELAEQKTMIETELAEQEPPNESESAKEQINVAVEEAAEFAANKNYEYALAKIKTALVSYPESSILQSMEIVYTDALAAQIKEKTMEEATASTEAIADDSYIVIENDNTPFYGIWCSASKTQEEAENTISTLEQNGFHGQLFVSSEWSNLNPEMWYVVTAGLYSSESNAYTALSSIQRIYPSAYIKYSGDYLGRSSYSYVYQETRSQNDPAHPAFYGIWCDAAKTEAEALERARNVSATGFSPEIFITSDWSNLNPVTWYVITAGVYSSEAEASAALPGVQTFYPDAYIKYSGNWQG